ncbi:MAG: TRAM domain-containing protein, partial [Parvimonas micra]
MELRNLEIIDNTNEGLGVAKSEEGIVFVKGGLVGDIVDVEITQKKKKFSNGYVKKYLKYSEYRENLYDEKLTDIYHFINLKYEKELKLKKKMFLDSLRKNTGIELEDVEILENKNNLNYRNKIELKTNENFELCYCVDNGESKIKLENCPLSDESINEFLPFLQAKLKEFKVKSYDVNTDEGILKNISIRSNFNSEIMITVVVKKDTVEVENFVKSLNEYEKLVSGYININPKKASIIMGQESKLIFSKKNFTDKIGKYEFNISPKSFFQVNRFQTENLYKIAKEFLGKNKDKNLLDLYSGIGTTSIYFSENFKKVIG